MSILNSKLALYFSLLYFSESTPLEAVLKPFMDYFTRLFSHEKLYFKRNKTIIPFKIKFLK